VLPAAGFLRFDWSGDMQGRDLAARGHAAATPIDGTEATANRGQGNAYFI